MVPAIKRVEAILLASGLTFEIRQFPKSTKTAEDAALTIGCEIAQIVKSLLFRTVETNRPILILASGKNRVAEQAIENLMGEKITKADADFTREITGFAIGGVPPLSNEKISTVVIDEDLMSFKTLWAAAGTPFAVFKLSFDDLQKITNGKTVSIKVK